MPDGRHDAQFLGNLVKGSRLGEPAESVNDSLFVSHNRILLLPGTTGKPRVK